MYRITSIRSVVLLCVLAPSLSGATFETLFPYKGPQGQKNVDISDDGSIVLGSNRGASHEAYIWELGKGVTHQYIVFDDVTRTGMSGDGKTILSVKYPGTFVLEDASFDGSVMAGSQGGYPYSSAIAVINGKFIPLGMFSGDNNSNASAVSADGSTIVGQSFTSVLAGQGYAIQRMEPFRWTAAAGMVSLGTLPGAYITNANDVSGDGSVVVGRAHFSRVKGLAYRWTETFGMQSLGDLPGNFEASEAFAVSANGSVIVGYGYGTEGTEAFFWTERHGMQNLREMLINEYQLDLQNYRLKNATGVSADGSVIVGWGEGLGQTFVWRVNLVPEPSALLPLVGVAISIPFTRRRNLQAI